MKKPQTQPSRSGAMRLLVRAARPLWPFRVEGAEHIDPATFPAVFVCNHDGPFGPMASILYLPAQYRPWIYAPNLDRSQTAPELYKRSFSPDRGIPPPVGRLLSGALAGPIHWALMSFDPIPVYRGTGKGIMETLTSTAAAMARGENILLFPENRRLTPNGRFPANGVGGFYTGFAAIAQGYTAASGKPCTFYPCYEGRAEHVFRIGPPLHFYAVGRPTPCLERRAIAAQLRLSIENLCHAKTEHP